MLYAIGILAVTVGLECFILWYGMKYGFYDGKRRNRETNSYDDFRSIDARMAKRG